MLHMICKIRGESKDNALRYTQEEFWEMYCLEQLQVKSVTDKTE